MEAEKGNFLEALSTEELRGLAEQYPWWGAVKSALHARGEKVEGSVLYALRARGRGASLRPLLKTINSAELKRSEMLGIIDDFLKEGEHRIVIDEQTSDAPLGTENSTEELEDEFVSEELAEIYAKQHLFDLAIEIYQKLSLQNSQKSIYFAEIIDRLEKERSEEDKK